jgi:hypothetical protein
MPIAFESIRMTTTSRNDTTSETSAKMYGFIDGAVRSGERVATEVMEREAMTVD